MEGGAALVDDVSRVLTFYDRGVRVISLTHLNNNELGGSGSPSIPLTNLSLQGDAGLTELGRWLLGEMRKYGMVVDLAHASARTFAEARLPATLDVNRNSHRSMTLASMVAAPTSRPLAKLSAKTSLTRLKRGSQVPLMFTAMSQLLGNSVLAKMWRTAATWGGFRLSRPFLRLGLLGLEKSLPWLARL